MAKTAGVLASSLSLTTSCLILKKAYPGALNGLSRGSKVRKDGAEVLSDRDSETTRCPVGLTLLVKVNHKIIQTQEEEMNSTSRWKE